MDRRKFFTVTGAGAAAAAAGSMADRPAQAQKALPGGACASMKLPPLKARMGHQFGPLIEENASWVARYGVDGICTKPAWQSDPNRLYPTVEEMNKMLDLAHKWKLNVELVDSVLLQSTLIDREKHPAIMLGQDPQRDRDIEAFQNHIITCSKTGIRCLKYNQSLLGVLRNGEIPGRGDTIYNTWNLKKAIAEGANKPLTKAGIVDADTFWERIDYFLARVVPVATEYKVQIACHPQDPGTPASGYRGIDRVLGTYEGLQKFVMMHESPYHGLNLCQGTLSENLENPREQLPDAVRWFGQRKKIFNVHFRNIRGHRNDFTAELFPDDGDIDFVEMLKVYREIQYPYLLMPDHAPRVPGQPKAWRETFPFEFGYIRGLIQAEQHLV